MHLFTCSLFLPLSLSVGPPCSSSEHTFFQRGAHTFLFLAITHSLLFLPNVQFEPASTLFNLTISDLDVWLCPFCFWQRGSSILANCSPCGAEFTYFSSAAQCVQAFRWKPLGSATSFLVLAAAKRLFFTFPLSHTSLFLEQCTRFVFATLFFSLSFCLTLSGISDWN